MWWNAPRLQVLLGAILVAALGLSLGAGGLLDGGPARAQTIGEQDRILVEDLLFRAQRDFIQAYFHADGSYLNQVLIDPELTFRTRDIFERYARRGVYAEFTLVEYRFLEVQWWSATSGLAITFEIWEGVLRTLDGGVPVGTYRQAARHLYTLLWTEEGWRIAEERVEDASGGWQTGPLMPAPTPTPTPTATVTPSLTERPRPTATPQPVVVTPAPAQTPVPPTPVEPPTPGPSPTATPPAPTVPTVPSTATPTPTMVVMPTPTGTPTAVAGAFRIAVFDGRSNPERVTIQNTAATTQNLGGWRLLATRTNQVFTIPALTQVEPGQQVTVISGANALPGEPGTIFWTSSFVFNDDRDAVQLLNPDGQVVDIRSY